MTRYRIHRSATPTRDFGPVLPIDQAEQRNLDELRARRMAKSSPAAPNAPVPSTTRGVFATLVTAFGAGRRTRSNAR